jgi:hypothetical protein
MEYCPNTSSEFLFLKNGTSALPLVQLNQEQEECLKKAHTFLGYHALKAGKPGMISTADMMQAMYAATDRVLSPSECSKLMELFSSDPNYMSYNDLKRLLCSGYLYPESNGRNWVALSLAEAETLRRVLHLRQMGPKRPDDPTNRTEIALRYSLLNGTPSAQSGDGGVIIDATALWARNGTAATAYEGAVAYNAFRFFDGDMHFPVSGLNILVRILQGRYTSFLIVEHLLM